MWCVVWQKYSIVIEKYQFRPHLAKWLGYYLYPKLKEFHDKRTYSGLILWSLALLGFPHKSWVQLLDPVCCKKRQKIVPDQLLVWRIRALNGTKLILDDHGNNLDSLVGLI